MRWTPAYHTACKIQGKILASMGVDLPPTKMNPKSAVKAKPVDDLSPKDLAALAGAWNHLEDRKRILRMKPLPKAQEVPQGRPLHERKSRSSFSET